MREGRKWKRRKYNNIMKRGGVLRTLFSEDVNKHLRRVLAGKFELTVKENIPAVGINVRSINSGALYPLNRSARLFSISEPENISPHESLSERRSECSALLTSSKNRNFRSSSTADPISLATRALRNESALIPADSKNLPLALPLRALVSRTQAPRT